MSVDTLYKDANVFISLTIRRQLCIRGGETERESGEHVSLYSICAALLNTSVNWPNDNLDFRWGTLTR